MKKLMTAAAVAAMTASAFAIDVTDCGTSSEVAEGCETVAFKITASGKIAQDGNEITKGTYEGETYKTVTTFKISSGYLLLNVDDSGSTEGETEGETTEEESATCCYDLYDLAATGKIGKKSFTICVEDADLEAWSLFGKDYAQAMDTTAMKAGSKKTLESYIGFRLGTDYGTVTLPLDEDTGYWNQMDTEYIDSIWVGFGKAVYGYSKGTSGNSSTCTPTEGTSSCETYVTPKSYSGYFAGFASDPYGSKGCMTCECTEYDLFGGTWKATYTSKLPSDATILKILSALDADDLDTIFGE